MAAGGRLELRTFDVSPRTQWRTVRLVAADGRRGLGEASDSGQPAAATAVLRQLAPHLRAVVTGHGLGPDEVRAWADAMLRVIPDSRQARAVLGGVEQALCDLFAADQGLPLWAWLGGAAPGGGLRVPCYANVNRVSGGRAPQDVARAAGQAVAAGFGTVKCAPFDEPEPGTPLGRAGLARIRAVREALGPEVTVLVDFHLRLGLDDVLALLPDLEALGVGWLEDAVNVSDVTGLRALRATTDLPLAGGEFSHDAAQFVPAVEQGLLDVLLLDVKHAGGITRAHRLAERARAVGPVAVSPHNPTGPVGTAASAHLFLATPGADRLEVAVGEVGWRAAVLDPPEDLTGGELAVSAAPGLGADLSDRFGQVEPLWSSAVEEAS